MDKLLQNETFARLLALALAILIYLQVVGGGVQRTVTGIPVEVAGLPTGLFVDSISPKMVALTVSGSASTINDLAAGGLQASVDLTAARVGSAQYYVLTHVPIGLQGIKATPADVTIVVEKLGQVNTTVVPNVTGVVPAGYGLGVASVSPKLVTLTGPGSALAQVDQTVVSVDVQSKTAPVTVQVAPVAIDKNGQRVPNVTVIPSEVTVTVPIAALPAAQAVVDPQVSGRPAAGYAVTGVTATPTSVAVTGAAGPLTRVQTQTVTVTGATASIRQVEPVIPPPGATAQPATVEVTVTIVRSG